MEQLHYMQTFLGATKKSLLGLFLTLFPRRALIKARYSLETRTEMLSRSVFLIRILSCSTGSYIFGRESMSRLTRMGLPSPQETLISKEGCVLLLLNRVNL